MFCKLFSKLQRHDCAFLFFCKTVVKAGTLACAVSHLTVLPRQHIVFKSVAIVTKRRLVSGDLRATPRKKEREEKKHKTITCYSCERASELRPGLL